MSALDIIVSVFLSVLISGYVSYRIAKWQVTNAMAKQNSNKKKFRYTGSREPQNLGSGSNHSSTRESKTDMEENPEKLREIREAHAKILRKVAMEIEKSCVDAAPVVSRSPTIPPIPNRNERPLWVDFVNTHMKSVTDHFPYLLDSFRDEMEKYSINVAKAIKEVEDYLGFDPANIIYDITNKQPRYDEKSVFYSNELIFTIINAVLGFIEEPEIKTERRIRKGSKTSDTEQIFLNGKLCAAVPETFANSIIEKISSLVSGYVPDGMLSLLESRKNRDNISTIRNEIAMNIEKFMTRNEEIYACKFILE